MAPGRGAECTQSAFRVHGDDCTGLLLLPCRTGIGHGWYEVREVVVPSKGVYSMAFSAGAALFVGMKAAIGRFAA